MSGVCTARTSSLAGGCCKAGDSRTDTSASVVRVVRAARWYASRRRLLLSTVHTLSGRW